MTRTNYKRQLELNKEYYYRNKEKVGCIQRKYRENNREKLRKYFNEYFKRPEPKLKKVLRKQRRRLLIGNSEDGSVTSIAIRGMLVGQRKMCKLCKASIEVNYHIDHIKPLSKGGGHIIENIQLLCPNCNLKKGSKYDSDPSTIGDSTGSPQVQSS